MKYAHLSNAVRNATHTQSPQNLTPLMPIGKNSMEIKILEEQVFRGSPASKIWKKRLNSIFHEFSKFFQLPFPGHNHQQTSFKVAEFVSSRTK